MDVDVRCAGVRKESAGIPETRKGYMGLEFIVKYFA